MKGKSDWNYTGDFFITKEEVITLRTLYLEYGDEEAKRTRLKLPYENIDIYEFCNVGYHAIDLFDILLFYQFGGKSGRCQRPLDLEFLCYIQFHPDYGIAWQSACFNFIDDMPLSKRKLRLNNRFKDTLILLKELDISLNKEPDPSVMKCFEVPIDLIYLESLEDYKYLSDNKLFNNLRIGLWYKKYGKYENALKFLEKARSVYRVNLFLFNFKHLDYIESFNEEIGTYQEIGVDNDNPDEYLDWWIAKSKLIKIPIELQLVAEETPSFQIGEIYLKQAEKELIGKQYQKAIRNYTKASRYFKEVENCMHLWYGEKRHSKYSSREIEDICKIEKPGKENELGALTDEQMELIVYLTMNEPIYLPLNIRAFQRNPYLERNLQICKSRLELLKGKRISVNNNLRFKEIKDIDIKRNKELRKDAEKELINKVSTDEEIINVINKIDKKDIEDDCKKKYVKIYSMLDPYSQEQLIKNVIYEKYAILMGIHDFLNSIGPLSRMLEKEVEITIKEIIKKHNLNIHIASYDYKINKLKDLLQRFGENTLKIEKQEIDGVIENLNRVSYLRSPFAHPIRGGTYDELLELRKILFGDDKEEDGLLYKLIRYRNI